MIYEAERAGRAARRPFGHGRRAGFSADCSIAAVVGSGFMACPLSQSSTGPDARHACAAAGGNRPQTIVCRKNVSGLRMNSSWTGHSGDVHVHRSVFFLDSLTIFRLPRKRLQPKAESGQSQKRLPQIRVERGRWGSTSLVEWTDLETTDGGRRGDGSSVR